MAVYLGLDSSTQSLTAIAIEVDGNHRRVIFEHAVGFDETFPQYQTKNGVLPHDDPFVARSSPQMWAEALDVLLGKIAKEGGIDLREIKAVSGSGQQHGSVYLDAGAESVLARLDPKKPLVGQIRDIFSRQNSPIWMDSSTAEQCRAITEAVGGEGVLALLTGSRAFERFTGPQIRRYHEQDPDGYEKTDKIHLVSSYMATLLAGKHAPIEPGDGAGMNLMDLAHKRWAAVALQATAPDLDRKLPELKDSWTIVGQLSPYWQKRHGYPPAKVVAWTGDNPSTLIGVGLVNQGKIAISLGTSDTLFGFMQKPRIDPEGVGHVFGSPTGDFMSLICFKNGSLARDRIRVEHGLDWESFSQALRGTKPGNAGAIMLPWFEPEITPTVLAPGVRRYALDPRDGPANVRAVVEAQMMSMAIHSQWMGVDVDTIHATGGASKNREILRVMADVHDADVYQFEVGNSAGLGAALRAYHADEIAENRKITWEEVVRDFTEPVPASRIQPVPERVALYAELKKVYVACESHALRGGEDPLPLIEAFRRRFGG
jgi:xylulokinase